MSKVAGQGLQTGRMQAAGSPRSAGLLRYQVPASRCRRVHAGEVDWTPGQRQIAFEGLCPFTGGTFTTASQLGSIRRGSDETACRRERLAVSVTRHGLTKRLTDARRLTVA